MEKIQRIKLRKVWDKEAESYTETADTSPDYLAHFKEIEAALGDVKEKKILDVGSGTGITSAYLAGRGGELYLVDISPKALDFQKKYFGYKKLKAKYFLRDAFKMKFPEKSFDMVWNGGVIEHFEDDKKVEMIKIMWNLVKPGGVLLISAPNARDLPFMAAKKILKWRKKWAFGFEDDLTATRIKKLARKAGINNYSVYAYNPVVGWWFFPYGKEITNALGLNKVYFHQIKGPMGHILIFRAQKNS